jgi:hypothetical protein
VAAVAYHLPRLPTTRSIRNQPRIPSFLYPPLNAFHNRCQETATWKRLAGQYLLPVARVATKPSITCAHPQSINLKVANQSSICTFAFLVPASVFLQWRKFVSIASPSSFSLFLRKFVGCVCSECSRSHDGLERVSR